MPQYQFTFDTYPQYKGNLARGTMRLSAVYRDQSGKTRYTSQVADTNNHPYPNGPGGVHTKLSLPQGSLVHVHAELTYSPPAES